MDPERQEMNVVFAGHVDHGKSTVVGRLMADAGSLPKGKLAAIKEKCRRQSKIFEYAFLLDSLIDEQEQGITIDVARAFFKTKKRDYLILDAPGHIEFLKNMISGAARAEAGFLVIDAKEGVKENSRRHGYMLSMLGIRQITVLVNKMDLVGYKKKVYNDIKKEYTEFLASIGVTPKDFLPISAVDGENIVRKSQKMPWFKGTNVLKAIDSFKKEPPEEDKPLRMPVQDVYKFTRSGDSRRIAAGRIESGTLDVGDDVIFLPSGKTSKIKTIEDYTKTGIASIPVGHTTGVTLTEQIYVSRGEIMCRQDEKCHVSTLVRCNIFWMGREQMAKHKEYKLKLGTSKVNARLVKIIKVLDASTLDSSKKYSVSRHEVAECLLECMNPIAFDLFSDIQNTGRFVIVDGYDVAGGGIITEFIGDKDHEVREQVFLREEKWYSSEISSSDRALMYGQTPKLILITGRSEHEKKTLARRLEKTLFQSGRKVYFLGIGNLLRGVDADIKKSERKEHIRRLGEVAHILMDAGLIVIATASDLTEGELKSLKTIVHGEELVTCYVGKEQIEGETLVDQYLDPQADLDAQIVRIMGMLRFKNIIYNV
ncbi:GTP-binding protein [Candidatus Altiarchaeota archaeon]